LSSASSLAWRSSAESSFCPKSFSMRWRRARRGRCSAGSNGFVGAVKVIPGEGLHIGPKHEIGVAFPRVPVDVFWAAFYCPAHHLENVRWSAPVGRPACLRRTPTTMPAPSSRAGVRRNRCDKTAVGQTPRADLHRFRTIRGKSANSPGWRPPDCLA